MTKSEIRAEFLKKRKEILVQDKTAWDRTICQKIILQKKFKDANHIALYAADEFEVNLSMIFEEFCKEKSFYFPRFNKESKLYDMVKVTDLKADFVVGKYGILEPKEELEKATTKELESMLFLVPGVAFDESCQRLGRGKGFYDRLLLIKDFSLGVFYDLQKVDKIPVEKHDIALDMIISEKEIFIN